MPPARRVPAAVVSAIRQAVREELAPLRQDLAELRGARAKADQLESEKLLLSMSRAEKLLGIGHGRISSLLRTGQIRTVPWLGRVKVPRAEVERLAREGLTLTGRRPRRRRAPGLCDPEALRRLDLSTL